MKIEEIRSLLRQEPTEEQLNMIEKDERIGVQKLYLSYLNQIKEKEKETERFSKMLTYEKQYWQQGINFVGGTDEAGRGPLAGPMVVAAVLLPNDIFISGLNDSKQLSAKKRELIYDEICIKALSITVNIVSVADIDRYNIYQAAKLGMEASISFLRPKPEVVLADAMPLQIDNMKTISLIHGDALSATIAAASIIAKVTRDRIMLDLDQAYPEYGFAANKGYGSQKHMEAIAQYGVTRWHRRTYEPVKSMIKDNIPTDVDCECKIFRIK